MRGPEPPTSSAFTGTTIGASAYFTRNFTLPYMPGKMRPSGFGTRSSVSIVRVTGSNAPALRATVATMGLPPSSRIDNSASVPAFTAASWFCGTLTNTRSVSLCASL